MTGSGSKSETTDAVAVTDRVRDVMVMTVPRLATDELEPLVEPDPFLQDDGSAKLFTKLFIYDEYRRVEISNEILDVMCIAVPSVGAFLTEGGFGADVPDVPDDGLEAIWAEELFGSETRAEVPEEIIEAHVEIPYEVTQEACEAFADLMATESGFEMPVDVPEVPEAAPVVPEEIIEAHVEVPYEVTEEASEAFADLIATESGFAVSVDVLPEDEVAEPVSGGIEIEGLYGCDDCGTDVWTVQEAEDEGCDVALAAPEAPAMISAPVAAAMLSAPVAVPGLPAPAAVEESVSDFRIRDDAAGSLPLVSFSFGPEKVREGGWRVSFTF